MNEIRRKAIKDLEACLTCPLCNQIYKDAVLIVHCRHVFCRECLTKCLKNAYKCPNPVVAQGEKKRPQKCGIEFVNNEIANDFLMRGLAEKVSEMVHALKDLDKDNSDLESQLNASSTQDLNKGSEESEKEEDEDEEEDDDEGEEEENQNLKDKLNITEEKQESRNFLSPDAPPTTAEASFSVPIILNTLSQTDKSGEEREFEMEKEGVWERGRKRERERLMDEEEEEPEIETGRRRIGMYDGSKKRFQPSEGLYASPVEFKTPFIKKQLKRLSPSQTSSELPPTEVINKVNANILHNLEEEEEEETEKEDERKIINKELLNDGKRRNNNPLNVDEEGMEVFEEEKRESGVTDFETEYVNTLNITPTMQYNLPDHLKVFLNPEEVLEREKGKEMEKEREREKYLLISQSRTLSPLKKKPVLLFKNEKRKVKACADFIGGSFTQEFSLPPNDPTHLIVKVDENNRCPMGLRYLKCLLSGCWIVNEGWLDACINAKRRVNEEGYQVLGDDSGEHDGGPNEIRKKIKKAKAEIDCGRHDFLFSNCVFFIHAGEKYPSKWTNNDFTALIGLGKGEFFLFNDLEASISGYIFDEAKKYYLLTDNNDLEIKSGKEKFIFLNSLEFCSYLLRYSMME